MFQIKLTVKFSTQSQANHPNGMSLRFKYLATVLLPTHLCITIFNWEDLSQNLIIKYVAISPQE